MRLCGLLKQQQIEEIHRNALRVLAEVGVQVEHEGLRHRLASVGGEIDPSTERARFPVDLTERRIWEAPKTPVSFDTPRIGLGCGVYQCMYLDPFTDEPRPFDEPLLAQYFGLAEHLSLDGWGVLGLPFIPEDIPAYCLPLAEKLYAWKYGGGPGGEVHFTALCEPLIEMFRIHADATGKSLEEVFCANGWLVSPLKLGRPECEQLLYFANRGLRMGIGHLPSQGGTAPVSFAGTLTLALAEQVFLFMLSSAVWGDTHFGIGSAVTTVDMRTGASMYGRPERMRTNLAFADIADYYGCSTGGHTGCADSYMPSCEAGAQKAEGALIAALATGHAYIEAGLLGVDTICSPVQMVLDCDLAGSMKALFAEAQADEQECAFDEILAAGIGGNHLGTEFTVERFRSELFEPLTWANQSFSAWRASGSRTDIDKAREIVAEFERDFRPESRISEEEERALRSVIEWAANNASP
jgi:trimethylamine--corrinoid protein Co-methyltransferase